MNDEFSRSDPSEPETCEDSPSTHKPLGLFSLLAEQDSDTNPDSGSDELPNQDDSLVNNQSSQSHPPKLSESDSQDQKDADADETLVEDTSKSQAKKKKKKKKKRKAPLNHTSQSDATANDPDWIALNEFQSQLDEESKRDDVNTIAIPSSCFNSDDDDAIRKEAQSIMSMIEAMAFPATEENVLAFADATTTCEALHVQPKLLNADAELKRLFGARAIDMERRDEEAAADINGRRRGSRAMARHTPRRRISLVQPRDTWIDHAPGLTLTLDVKATEEAGSDVRYFRYTHEPSYAHIQEEYRVVVNTHNPDNLVALASRHPYHVDTLLQLAELYRQMGELDRAAEQIERCLYILEGAWIVSFKPFDGTCRLNFDVLENRSMYVSLFRYSQLLTRRGLHRTALEISKLLLNLDPEKDPMGMLMLADSYALLSGEYKWVQLMAKTFKHIPIQYFPNFAVSCAVAEESIRLGMTGISNRGTSSKGRKGKSDAEEQSEMTAEDVKEMLTDAILTFPMVVKHLLNAVEHSSPVWTESRLFEEGWYTAGYVDMRVLSRMCRVYAERSKLLWNSSHNKELLVECARNAGRLDEEAGMGMDQKTGRLSSEFVKDEIAHGRVAKCRALRIESAQWLRLNGLYQHVQIADFSDSTTNLPAEVLVGDEGVQPIGAPQLREISLARGALEFFQSLLPWRDARDARDDQT